MRGSESFAAQMMGFIDDQHWQLSLLLGQTCDFVAKRTPVPLAVALSLLGQSEFECKAVQGIKCAAGGSCCITCRRQRESGVIVGTTPACDMGDAPAPLLIAFGQCRWCGQGRSTERLSAVDGFGLFRILNNFLSENSEKKQFKLYRLIGSTTRLENGGYEWTRTTDLSIMSAAL